MTDAPDIVMYSSGWCGYCARARALLAHGRDFKADYMPARAAA